jgi:hypothetical protein
VTGVAFVGSVVRFCGALSEATVDVREYEATRKLVLAFVADCEEVLATFDASGQATPATGERVRAIREKWDQQAKSRGRRLSGSGRYGALAEAILRLPRINRPREWHTALYDAQGTAKSCL